jgi:hypothetical protein
VPAGQSRTKSSPATRKPRVTAKSQGLMAPAFF